MSTPPPFDLIDQILSYEKGELSTEKVIELFQYLLDTGIIWRLQGHYGRTATEMLKSRLLVIQDEDYEYCLNLVLHQGSTDVPRKLVSAYLSLQTLSAQRAGNLNLANALEALLDLWDWATDPRDKP